MSSIFRNKLAFANMVQQLVAGLQKNLATGSLVVATTTYPTSQLVTSFNSLISAITATATAKAAYQAAVEDEEKLFTQLSPLVSGVRQSLYLMYKGAVDTLADFGISPHKAPVMTPAQRVVATAKAKATRLARHTMSKKAKLAITGSTVAAPASQAAPPVVVSGSSTPHTS
jgi:hypothetical protein